MANVLPPTFLIFQGVCALLFFNCPTPFCVAFAKNGKFRLLKNHILLFDVLKHLGILT